MRERDRDRAFIHPKNCALTQFSSIMMMIVVIFKVSTFALSRIVLASFCCTNPSTGMNTSINLLLFETYISAVAHIFSALSNPFYSFAYPLCGRCSSTACWCIFWTVALNGCTMYDEHATQRRRRPRQPSAFYKTYFNAANKNSSSSSNNKEHSMDSIHPLFEFKFIVYYCISYSFYREAELLLVMMVVWSPRHQHPTTLP